MADFGGKTRIDQPLAFNGDRISIGDWQTNNNSPNTLVVGSNNRISSGCDGSVLIGQNSTLGSNSESNIVIGGSISVSDNAIANFVAGTTISISGNENFNVAIGRDISLGGDGTGNVVIGWDCQVSSSSGATHSGNILIGTSVVIGTEANGNVCLNASVYDYSDYCISIGTGSVVGDPGHILGVMGSIAIGFGAAVGFDHSIAIGDNAIASATHQVVIGGVSDQYNSLGINDLVVNGFTGIYNLVILHAWSTPTNDGDLGLGVSFNSGGSVTHKELKAVDIGSLPFGAKVVYVLDAPIPS